MSHREACVPGRWHLLGALVACALGIAELPIGCRTVPEGSKAGPRARIADDLSVVTLDSPVALISVKVMVRAGSAMDPEGKEGLASLTARALLEGGAGDPAAPLTKERIAEIVLPWGDGALPGAQVSAETTTFHLQVPADVLGDYIARVLRPVVLEPLFLEAEISRLKTEMASRIPRLRFESLEGLGLSVAEQFILEGTRYAHEAFGTEESLRNLAAEDIRQFYRSHYHPGNMTLGVSSTDADVVDALTEVFQSLPRPADLPAAPRLDPPPLEGRHGLVVEEPNAPATSIHIGFPIEVTRTHPDFWPLYVANTWFGTHRDSFSHLYRVIRQERGYNYGDYSYIEHWGGRSGSLFQIFNQPRSRQYFSIWIRPVAHEYAHHIAKGASFELEKLVRDGLTEEQVSEAKTKARVLYLNLAETADRLLAAKLDDAFYGQSPGFLEGYLESIDGVTVDDVNRAIRRHLQTDRLKYVFVTDAAHSGGLVAALEADGVALGKGLADYQIETTKLDDGTMVWQVPESRVETLKMDAVWAHYRLGLDSVLRVAVNDLFQRGDFVSR